MTHIKWLLPLGDVHKSKTHANIWFRSNKDCRRTQDLSNIVRLLEDCRHEHKNLYRTRVDLDIDFLSSHQNRRSQTEL